MLEMTVTPTRAVLRPDVYAEQRLDIAAVRRVLESLDPVQHDAEIVHLSMEVLTPPLVAHSGYVAGSLRTLAVPRVAERIVRGGAGKQLKRPQQRDHDTLSAFASMIRRGHRAQEGQSLGAHIAKIHDQVGGIEAEDQLYTLGQLIFAGEDLAGALHFAPYSYAEQRAGFSFWTGLGRTMGLPNMPTSPDLYRDFMRAYEARLYAPSRDAKVAAEAHLRGMDGWCPAPLRPLLRSFVLAALPARTLSCLGLASPPLMMKRALRMAVRGAYWRHNLRPLRLAASLSEVVPHG